MRIKDSIVTLVMVALLLPASVGAGEEAIRQHLGKILIDTSNHGEAWYVNPQSLQRVYLGKPDEALYELNKRAVRVNFSNIERIGLDGMVSPDPEYADQVAGYIVAPNDLHGAAWWVHPVMKTRHRLGTPHDAWQIMKAGEPTTSAVLDLIPEEGTMNHDPKGIHKVKEVLATDLLVLEDDTEIRLMSVDAPDNAEYQEPAKARMTELIAANDMTVRLDHDVVDTDREGRKLRMVTAGDYLLNLLVVQNGWAFHNIEAPNFLHAEQMVVGGLDAEMHSNGFWNK
jgi:endonuclease YncB( thermonuclease family)